MKRILTAIVLIFAVFALFFFGQLWMITVFAAIVAELAAYEYLQLANTGSSSRIPVWWMALGTAVLFSPRCPIGRSKRSFPFSARSPSCSSPGTASGCRWNACCRSPAQGLFGLIYIAYPLALVPLLWKQEDGIALVVFLMVCVWSGDIAALYIGRNFGKHKLAPRLSPNKTWEGTIASIAGSVLAAGLVILISDQLTARGNTSMHISEPLWQSLLLAVVLNLAAQLGDLLESAIKRGAGVKDSGTMLPGHGGILDRIDALLLAAPVLWYVLMTKDALGLGRF